MRFSMEPREPQFRTPEQPSSAEIAKAERDLNEIIPILAHGLVRRIEQKGFSGKVRVTAMAGDSWGVGKSPDNPTDVPNVIIYPREALSGDKRLMNARLRHEIGNLNYPIDTELNGLRDWCQTNHIAPELLTSIVEATHEASVNFLEMQNSHSSNPEENFRALYEEDINTQQIADSIGESVPYKQAIDLTLLYSLAQTGLIPALRFEQALASAHPAVQGIFDKQTRSVLDQTVRMAVPKKQVQLVREYLWPKFSHLVALSGAAQEKAEATATVQKQAQEVLDRIKKLMDQMGKKPEAKSVKKPRTEKAQKPEKKMPKRQEMSPAEQHELQEEKDLLAQNLQEQLQQAKEQLQKLQQPGEQSQAPKPQEKPSSMQEIGQQAEQMKNQAEKAIQEAKEAGAEEITEEELQKLKEQLEQLEEVAKQISESGELEKELEKPEEEEPINYNIKEYGIDESTLTQEQLEHLNKVRTFAQNTSRVYRTAMRLVMRGYQQKNPNFSDKTLQKIMECGFDIPEFSIYGSQAAADFMSERQELGIDGFSDNFLVNFQLPRPLAKFWYKGGDGKLSQPVKEGEIEWGYFYRMCMPVIYSGVDRAQMSGLYLNRINQFGQHDPKKYYYLWEAINMAMEDQDANQSEESSESEESEQGEQGEGQEQGGESQGQQGEGEGQGQGEGAGESGGEGGEQGGQGGQMGGGEGGGESGGGMPSAQEMQDMISQMKEVLENAKEQAGQGGAGQAIDQMLQQLSEMQQGLESGAGPQEMAGQMQDAMQQLSDMMGGMEGGEGNGQGESSSGDHERSTDKQSGGQIDEAGFEKSKIQDQSRPFDPSHQGGAGNTVEGEGMTFSRPDPNLLAQLRNSETLIGSKFTQQDEHGTFEAKDIGEQVAKISQAQLAEIERKSQEQLSNLDELKRQQQAKMESLYREMSGLDGEALRVYAEYMESMRDLTDDLTDFFIEKFDLDREYIYERNQRRGARLQRGYTKNVLGMKEGRVVMSPRSFERKRTPEMPQFVWTIILDNTGSVGGMIEDEKKLAIALMEVTKRLNIPFEVVVYTEGGYNFLKTFDQEAFGEDLQKIVLLQATIGNQQDTDLLRAAYTSQTRYSDKFKRTHNFIFFLTDGLACSADSLHDLVQKFKKETVILGVGLAQGAKSIKKEFGKNALEVPDSKQLSIKFIRKVEDLVDTTFN